jgi:hypothetical protein
VLGERTRRATLGVVLTAALAAIPIMAANPTPASAGIDEYCLGAILNEGQTCRDPNFRFIKWSRVKKDNFAAEGCAGAYNSNNVEVGGWTCTTTGLQATNFYDGSRNLRGAVLDNFGNNQKMVGTDEF